MDVWEAIEVHHTGEKGTYMHIAPLEKVDIEWLKTILPNAKCHILKQTHGLVISSLWLTEQVYLRKHLHQVLRKLRDQGRVTFHGYEGRFAFSKNPLVCFG